MSALRKTNDVPAFEPALDLSRRFVEEVMEELESREDIYGSRVDEVENKSRDGFIPYTDGGFEGIGYQSFSYCWGSGNAPKIVQPYVDSSVKDAEQEWDRENPEHPIEWIYDEEANDNERKQLDMFRRPGQYLPTQRDTWREKWHEFMDEWMSEGGTFFYKARALFYDADSRRNQSGKPEVYFFVGINIPWLRCYGADPQQSKWCWERNVPVEDLTEELVTELVKEATTALNDM